MWSLSRGGSDCREILIGIYSRSRWPAGYPGCVPASLRVAATTMTTTFYNNLMLSYNNQIVILKYKHHHATGCSNRSCPDKGPPHPWVFHKQWITLFNRWCLKLCTHMIWVDIVYMVSFVHLDDGVGGDVSPPFMNFAFMYHDTLYTWHDYLALWCGNKKRWRLISNYQVMHYFCLQDVWFGPHPCMSMQTSDTER